MNGMQCLLYITEYEQPELLIDYYVKMVRTNAVYSIFTNLCMDSALFVGSVCVCVCAKELPGINSLAHCMPQKKKKHI